MRKDQDVLVKDYLRKTIQKSSNKYPTYLFKVNDEWVPRGQVPEVIEYKKKRRNIPELRIQDAKTKLEYYTKNKTELNAKAKIRKTANKEKYWQINNNFNNSEYGFIMNLYSGARLECKKGRNGSDILIPFKFTKESWWQHWLDQKERYGMICPYSKVEMTHIRGGSRGKIKRKLIPTNISRDQVWPSRGYTPDNLIFCTVKFNSNKRSITPDGCQAVIDVHNEMMDRWHTKLCFDKNLSRASVSGKDKNGKSFLSNELDRLRKSIGKKGMKQFYQVAYEQCKREREKNETQ